MAYTMSVVILANSVKQGGYCVAGKDIRTGQWIRPVSTPIGGALHRQKLMVKNPYGRFVAKPLQIVDMAFERPAPLPTQPENHLLATETWIQHFKAQRDQLRKAMDNPEHLWMHGNRSDRFPLAALKSTKRHQSLYLVYANEIQFCIDTNCHSRKKVIGTFRYKGETYSMGVTDPAYFKYTKLDVGYEWEERGHYLCVSQTDAFHGYCYKVIAAIL